MDNLKLDKYTRRLVDEWNQHGKIIIAVDYDDTISPWRWSKEDLQDTINLIKECSIVGAYIVIFTSCSPDRYGEIDRYCKENDIPVDTINQNPLSLPYGNDNKIYANIFLDDRAGLEGAKKMLRTALYLQRAQKFANSNYDEIG